MVSRLIKAALAACLMLACEPSHTVEPPAVEPPGSPPLVAPGCEARTCASAGRQCGPLDDGCGAVLECGVCETGVECRSGTCTARPPPPENPPTEPAPVPGAIIDLGSQLPLTRTGTHGDRTWQDVSCQRYTGVDTTYAWTAPRAGTYVFETAGSDHQVALAIKKGRTGDEELGCSLEPGGGGRAASITLALEAGEYVRVVLDNAVPEHSYTLHIHEVGVEACADGRDNDGNGAFDCNDSACVGTLECSAEGCHDVDLQDGYGSYRLPVFVHGTTRAPLGRFATSCGDAYGAATSHLFKPPSTGTYYFYVRNIINHDEVSLEVAILTACGGGQELACGAGRDARWGTAAKLERGVPVLVVVTGGDWFGRIPGQYELFIFEDPSPPPP